MYLGNFLTMCSPDSQCPDASNLMHLTGRQWQFRRKLGTHVGAESLRSEHSRKVGLKFMQGCFFFFLLQQKGRHHVRYQGHSHMIWSKLHNLFQTSSSHGCNDLHSHKQFVCVCVCTCVYVYVYIFYIIIYMMCVRKRAHQLPWNWSSRLLWATWHGSWAENWTKCSGRTAGSFNYWAISLAFLWASKEQKNNKMCTGQSCYFFRPHMVPRWQSPSQSKASPLLPQPSMQNSVLLLVIMPMFSPTDRVPANHILTL